MADANREVAAHRLRGAAKRGRLSERRWLDVVRAARYMRGVGGVTLRMHGVEFVGTPNRQMPAKSTSAPGMMQQQQQQEKIQLQPPQQTSTTLGDTLQPSSLSNRRQRCAHQLQEFPEAGARGVVCARGASRSATRPLRLQRGVVLLADSGEQGKKTRKGGAMPRRLPLDSSDARNLSFRSCAP